MASPSEPESSPFGSQRISDGQQTVHDAAFDRERLTRSAGTVSIGVMVSRVLGLVREQVLAYLFSARIVLDAFYAAFRLPNLFRDMFGEGALGKAFVSTFSEIQEKEGKEAALRLVSVVLNAMILVMAALTLAGILHADGIVAWVFPGAGFDTPLVPDESYGFATKRDLTVRLTQIMFPFIFFASLAALVMGVLNARGRFLVPALASAFFNIGSIVVGVTGYYIAPRYGQHPAIGMAIGVLVGGILQLMWQLPSLFRLGYRYRPNFDFRDPWLGKVLRLFGPGALIASTVQVNLLVNSIFASRGEGWMTWIIQAFRILHLPLGLVAVAVSVATLPALSRAAAKKDTDGFSRHVLFRDATRDPVHRARHGRSSRAGASHRTSDLRAGSFFPVRYGASRWRSTFLRRRPLELRRRQDRDGRLLCAPGRPRAARRQPREHVGERGSQLALCRSARARSPRPGARDVDDDDDITRFPVASVSKAKRARALRWQDCARDLR